MSGARTAFQGERYRLEPGAAVSGTLRVPGDKSVSHRALMLGGVAEGVTEVEGFLPSGDCLSTLAAMRALGVEIERPSPDRVVVHGRGAVLAGAVREGSLGLRPASGPIDLGNSGTAMRLLTGLLAGQSFDSTLVGDASLMRRPMERVAVPLRRMGARIVTQDGRPPVRILAVPALHGIEYELPVASAQVKSAVLLAGLTARGRTSVAEPAPTRDHTERMLAAFGVELTRSPRTVSLQGGQALRAAHIEVPGDFSSAAFFLVAGCLGARGILRLENVGVNPTRTGLLALLGEMGGDITVVPRKTNSGRTSLGGGGEYSGEPIADIEVRAGRLRGITVPEALVPLAIDEFPAFFVAAACAEGETVVRGAEELRVKETDRLAVMAEGLGRLGVEVELLEDGLRIHGQNTFKGGTVDSHGDHRIAMAFAVASLRASGMIEVRDVANVATSFPGFSHLARAVGLKIEVSGST